MLSLSLCLRFASPLSQHLQEHIVPSLPPPLEENTQTFLAIYQSVLSPREGQQRVCSMAHNSVGKHNCMPLEPSAHHLFSSPSYRSPSNLSRCISAPEHAGSLWHCSYSHWRMLRRLRTRGRHRIPLLYFFCKHTCELPLHYSLALEL